ncbi:MAG: FapA family protein [Lachnospiraceae bacterium]
MGNGYFRLVSMDGGFGLEIKAPSGNGEQVRIGEVTDYLMQRNVACDLSALKTAISQGKDTVLPLGKGECPVEAMTYQLSINEDSMRATARFYAPSQTGQKMSVQEFLGDLSFRQIRFGVMEERIREAFEKEEYCTDIIVAEGKPARQGTDASIEYFFNTDLKARPTVMEDGSVDFFHLNTINHCEIGDVLARLIPADPGEDGMNIQGTRIKPRNVKNAALKFGNNIELSEDKTVLTSKVNGHVTLVEDRVFVSDVLQLENVDISTGNIEYVGSVEIKGNVQSNFSVKAGGNIIVNGLVEGAYLEAGGDIVITRGMTGMSKGELKAEGNIVAKFLESTKASAGGYITAESILHSTVMAGGDITVDGRKGFISGGRVCATNLIQVKTLGSPMGTSTVIEVGADPVVKIRFQQMQKEVAELNKVIKSLEPIIASYVQKRKQGVQLSQEQLKYLTSILKLREQKMPELEKATKEMETLQEVIEQQSQAQVVVKGEVFPGVKIAIGDVSMVVQSSMKYCKFIKLRGDVKMVGI